MKFAKGDRVIFRAGFGHHRFTGGTAFEIDGDGFTDAQSQEMYFLKLPSTDGNSESNSAGLANGETLDPLLPEVRT